MLPRWTVAALGLSGLLRALPCAAQPQDAQAIFREGIDAFTAGNYRRAVDAFERVFALRGNPDLLFNLYRCHRAMGDAGRAAQALRRFLVARPDRADRVELEAELARLDAQARALAPPTPTPTPTPDPPPTTPTLRVALPARATASTPAGLGPGPWIVVGVGVALSGVGAGLMLAAAGSQGDANGAPSESARASTLEGAASQHTVGAVMAGVGGAVVLGGALWRLLTPRAPSVGAVIGADRAALTMSVRWP